MNGSDPMHRGDARFLTTRWSIVTNAARGDAEARSSLEELCTRYWYPLYAFLRRRGAARSRAEDLVQGFFTLLLERGDLAGVDREKGRFRSWLLTSLRHYEQNEDERARAEKRGGGRAPLSFDWEDAENRYHREPAATDNAEREFERAWALRLLERAFERLRSDYDGRGKLELFEALKDELTPGAEPTPRAELATRVGLREGALKVALHRMRSRYGDALRAEVRDTVADESEVDGELGELFAALAATS